MQASLRAAWSDHPGRVILIAVIAGAALLWLRGRWGISGTSIPPALRREVEHQYAQCVSVVGSDFRGDMNPERACREVDVEPVGAGVVPADETGAGVASAFCFRVILRTPSWLTPSRTQFEEIGWTERVQGKVALLLDGEWIIPPDREDSDRSRWRAYACEGEY